MSSRTRNFRRRGDDGDDGDNSDVHSKESTTTTTTASAAKSSSKLAAAAAAAKPKKQNPQAPKLLSFADDEDSDSPLRRRPSKSFSDSNKPKSSPSSRLSKMSSSHKITSVKDRGVVPSFSPLPSNVQPQAGTYTKEALLELQKNTKTLASSRPPPPPPDSKPPSEPVIVLKGLVKPTDSKGIAGVEREEYEFEEEDEVKRERVSAETQLGLMGIGKGVDSSGSLIPDQATINAIRAKRERLRQSRPAAADYISLDGGSNHGASEGLSDEEPEFQGRIAMFGEKDSGKKGVFEEVDERMMDGVLNKGVESQDDEEDEEEKIWEEEQFRKGLGKRMDDGSSRTVSCSVPVVQSTQQPKFVYPAPATVAYPSASSVAVPPSIGGAVETLQGLDGMSASQQAELARKALQENVRRLKVWLSSL